LVQFMIGSIFSPGTRLILPAGCENKMTK
jgi:hypothetical protein